MTDEELKALEERERQARASSENLEKGERLAKSIAAETKKQESLQSQITNYLNAPKPTAGTIKQFIEAPFSNLNVIDAIHQANAKENIGVQEYIETVAKAHAKNVRDNIATMFSGKDYMGERKNYKNILNQAGMKNDALTSDFVKKTKWLPNTPTILGLAGDIASDPMNAVPVTPIFNAVKNIGKFGIEMASKAPKIEKGINALRSRLNLFHDIEKTMPAEDVAKFKQGVQEWTATGKTSMLESLGYDMRKYVNTKAGSNVTDPATKANYKFKGPREFVQDTAELLKAKDEVIVLQSKLQNAKATEKAVYNQWQTQDSLRAAWKKSPQMETAQQTINQLQKDIEELTKKAAGFKAADNIATRKQLTEQIKVLQSQKDIVSNNVTAAKKAKETNAWGLVGQQIRDTVESPLKKRLKELNSIDRSTTAGHKAFYDVFGGYNESKRLEEGLLEYYKNRARKARGEDGGFFQRLVDVLEQEKLFKEGKLLGKTKTVAPVQQYDTIINEYSSQAEKLASEIAALQTQKKALAPKNIKQGYADQIAAKQAELAKISQTASSTEPVYVDLTSAASNARASVIAIEKQLAEKQANLATITKANKVIDKGYDDYYKVLDEIAEPAAPKTKAGKVADKYIGTAMDYTSGAFKRLMSWSPIFQTRNAIAGMFQGMTEGSTLRNYWDALSFAQNTWGGKTTRLLENTAEFTARYKMPESVMKDNLQKGGAMSQAGMYEQPLSRLPGKVANFFETWNRTALVLADIGKGKGMQEAMDHSMKTFYQYSSKTMTPFERQVLRRIDPFFAFDKAQMLYMPKALAENKNWYNIAAKLKEGTKPDSEKENPLIVPNYRKDQFSLGSVGNFGFQAEDFLRLAMLDWKTAYSKTAPAIKAITEGTLDYNIFSGKQISKDNKAGQYANFPEPMRKLLGYDQDTDTVNPWMKWMMGIMTGPLMKPVLNSVDPKKDAWSVITSTREYDTSEKNMLMQDRMNQRAEANGGFWGNNRFSGTGSDLVIGPRAAGAATLPGALTKFQEFVAKWERVNKAPGTFGKEYQFDATGGNVQNMFASQMLRWGKDRAENLKYAGNIAQGDEASHQQTLANIAAENKFYLRDRKDADQALLDEQIKHDKTRIRKAGEGSAFSDYELKNFNTGGFNSYQIAFNKEKERFVSANSRLAETWRAAGDKSPQSIRLAADAERESARASGRSTEWLEKMYAAIKAKEDHALSELEAKHRIAYANILSNMADAEINAYEKIEINRQAAQQKYRGSDDFKYAKARNDYEEIKLAEKVIDEKFAQQKRDQFVKDAKAEMEQVEKYAKGKAENIIAVLKGIYERGGKTIDEFYNERLKAQSEQHKTKAGAAINIAQASMRSAVDNGKRTLEGRDVDYTIAPMKGKYVSFEVMQNFTKNFEDILKTSKSIKEFHERLTELNPSSMNIEAHVSIGEKTKEIVQAAIKELETLKDILSNPNLDPRTAVHVMEDALAIMSTKIKGIDVSGMREAMKGLADAASDTSKNVTDASNDLANARLKLNAALIELTDATKKLQVETLHIQATTPSGLTLDRSMRPQWRTPDISEISKLADVALQQEKDNALKSRAQSLSKSLAGVSGYIGAVGTNADGSENRDNLGLLKFDETNGNSEKYMADVKEMTDTELVKTQIMADGEKNRTGVVSQGTQNRLNVLMAASQEINTQMQASAAQQVSIEQAAAQKRLSIAGDMASMLGQTASMIYEASGKKSKEAFYVMKAVAMAEAIIKGTQTIISSMAAGASVGGPAAPAIAAAYGAIAAAMVGAQIGIIAAQTVSGPGKAEGGPIEGGSGTKDDVPIMAMGGEFVIRKSSTQKYGAAFLDALNKGLIPVSDLNFNIPVSASPNYGQTHFGEGGMVASRMEPKDIRKDESQSVQIVNVIDPQLLDKYLASNAGQKTLVNVLAANRYELQQIMR